MGPFTEGDEIVLRELTQWPCFQKWGRLQKMGVSEKSRGILQRNFRKKENVPCRGIFIFLSKFSSLIPYPSTDSRIQNSKEV